MKCSESLQNLAFGCMFGAFLGDSIGSYVEFEKPQSSEKIKIALKMPGGGPFQLAPGQITDDSEHSICLGRGLINSGKNYDFNKISIQYKFWVNSRPFDIGFNTQQAFEQFVDKKLILDQKQNLQNLQNEVKLPIPQVGLQSESNGCLMRLTPLAIYCLQYTKLEQIQDIVTQEVHHTHRNQLVIQSCIVYVMAIYDLIKNPKNFKETYKFIDNLIKKNFPELKEWWNLVETNTMVDGMLNMGHAKIAWSYSFILLKKLAENPQNTNSNVLKNFYLESQEEILAKGGDTDTNCCIAGGLLGAMVGFNNLPYQQVEILYNCDTSKGRIRPEYLHPRNCADIVNSILEIIN